MIESTPDPKIPTREKERVAVVRSRIIDRWSQLGSFSLGPPAACGMFIHPNFPRPFCLLPLLLFGEERERERESNSVGPMPSEHVKVFFCWWGESVTLSRFHRRREREKKEKERTDGKSVPFCRNWGDGGRGGGDCEAINSCYMRRKRGKIGGGMHGPEEERRRSSFVRFPCKTINHRPPPPPPLSVNVCFCPRSLFWKGGKKKKYGFISLRSGLINIS